MKTHLFRITPVIIILALLVTALPAAGQGDTPPIPIDQLEVVSVVNTGEIAGPARTSAFLAPSGEVFAHRGEELCLYRAPSGDLVRCFPLDEDLTRRIDNENVRWSPDGRYLALGQDQMALRMFRDSDLVILDVETGQATNITDDAYDGALMMREVETTAWIDLSPRWLPDGNLLFLRMTQTGEEISPTYLYRVAPDGSGLEQLAALPGERLQVYWFNVSPDTSRIAYGFEYRGDDRQYWVYTSDLDGRNIRPLYQSDFPIYNATFSPDGQYLLTNDARLGVYAARYDDMEASPARVVDVNTGQVMLVDDTHFVRNAGWSPSGHGLAYVTTGLPDDPSIGLYLATGPGQPGRLVLEGRFYPPTSIQWPPIPWGANNVVLLSSSENQQLQVIQLGAP